MCINMEAYACCCSFQTMQKCFGLVRCICQYRYVIGVVGVGNCCCGVSSASFLRQFEAINLLSTSIHGYQAKRKKKTPGTRDKNISNHRQGEKRKNIIGQKKEKANFVTPVEKKQEICSQLVKRKIEPTVKCRYATITKVLNTSRTNYKN